jgi:hypothetical protein
VDPVDFGAVQLADLDFGSDGTLDLALAGGLEVSEAAAGVIGGLE